MPELVEVVREVVACAAERGVAADPHVAAIIDYSRPSTAPRLWIFDLDRGGILYEGRVAHGVNTGEDLALAFSNREGSRQSSLGVFRAAEIYEGQHGRSLRLDGLEPGFNDRARDRAIVIHGADYVTDAFVAEHGRLGRSWGCPAVAPTDRDRVLDLLDEQALLIAWYPDPSWQQDSVFFCR